MKKNKLKKIITLMMAAAMVFTLLSACGNDDDPDGSEDPSASDEYVYVPKYLSIDGTENLDSFSSSAYHDGMIYTVGYSYTSVDPDGNVLTEDDEDYWRYARYSQKLYCLNIDGTDFHELEGYAAPAIEEGVEGYVYINSLFFTPEGDIIVYESGYMYRYNLPDNFDPETDYEWNYYEDLGSVYYLRRLNPDGSEKMSYDITSLAQESEYFYVYNVKADGEGNVYMVADRTLYILGSDGLLLFKLESDNYLESMVRLNTGEIAVLTYGDNGTMLKTVDLERRAWGDNIEYSGNYWNLYDGSGEYSFYIRDTSNLIGFKLDTQEEVKLINWIDCDINVNYINYVEPLEDGRILLLMYNYSSSSSSRSEIALLTKTPASEVVQKTILTLATWNLGYYTREKIIDFNRTNENYRITVVDYSEYNTDEDYYAGLTKMSTEILSGKIPDIMSVSSEIPIETYASRGLLQDLYTYIDSDPELSRDDLVQGYCRVMEIDGALYQAGSNFDIITTIANGNIVGDSMGWTFNDVKQLLSTLPEGATMFTPYYTRDTVMYYFCMAAIDEYIDWKTGACSFDSSQFIDLLEFVNTFPVEYNWEDNRYDYYSTYENLATGKQLCDISYAGDLDTFRMYDAILNGAVFKGLPTEEGAGHYISVSDGYVMFDGSQYKDAAWEFIRYMFTEEYQDNNVYYSFPTNQNSFDKLIQNAMVKQMEKDEDGNEYEVPKYSWYISENQQVDIYALTQEQADKIYDLVDNVSGIASYNSSVLEIIQEEAAAFFEGQKTASAVASIIQSRVRIYVSEQM